VLWIHEGKLVMDGDPKEVCVSYKKFIGERKKHAQAMKKKQ
jgi:ABC-type polysaccharide/polyol phosphate transport system ATPase subunit